MNESPIRAFVAASGDYRWDRVELLRHWEFLKWLFKASLLEA